MLLRLMCKDAKIQDELETAADARKNRTAEKCTLSSARENWPLLFYEAQNSTIL